MKCLKLIKTINMLKELNICTICSWVVIFFIFFLCIYSHNFSPSSLQYKVLACMLIISFIGGYYLLYKIGDSIKKAVESIGEKGLSDPPEEYTFYGKEMSLFRN